MIRRYSYGGRGVDEDGRGKGRISRTGGRKIKSIVLGPPREWKRTGVCRVVE